MGFVSFKLFSLLMYSPNIISGILFAVILIIVIVIVFKVVKKYQKKFKEDRIHQKTVVEGMYQNILLSNNNFNKFISFKDGYFNNNKLSIWKASVNSLYNDLAKYKIESLKLESNIFFAIEQLRVNYNSGETIRTTYNKKYIERELIECDSFFSNIDGQSVGFPFLVQYKSRIFYHYNSISSTCWA